MILLKKRRSQSESRKVEQTGALSRPEDNRYMQQRQQNQNQELQQQFRQSFAFGDTTLATTTTTTNSSERRKTSAEMISEAKSMLAEISTKANSLSYSSDCLSCGGGSSNSNRMGIGGVRVVSTRRPITPRETGRALYGKVALAGRPPSAFSLRYLQNENQRHAPITPSLEPIPVHQQEVNETNENEFEEKQAETRRRISRRSNSWDARCDYDEVNLVGGGGTGQRATNGQANQIPRKLPALEIRGVSLEAKQRTDAGTKRERFKTAHSSGENSSLDMSGSNTAINILSSRKFQQRNSHLLAQSPTEKLIGLLKEHAGLKECNEETANHINSILAELYMRVRKNEKHYKRGFILGGLYGLVECSSPKILLSIARVVLALRVTGSNLTGACKLIFKVARNEQNDQLFHDNDLLDLLIDGLGRASPLDDPEACIYGYGSIRFLTSSSNSGQERGAEVLMPSKDTNRNWTECLELPRKPATAPAPGSDTKQALFQSQHERYQKLSKQNTLVERLARHGAVELMVLHLQILNEAGATQKLTGPPLHSLYQLSAALRALSDVRQTRNSFEKDLNISEQEYDWTAAQEVCGMQQQSIQLELACPHLVRAAEVATGELEVQANIVRTLSVLSEDSDCCHVLVNYTARIGMLLGPCCEIFDSASEKLLSLFSRLGYILGNIMAKYDSARVQFYHNDVAMQYLLRVLELYSKEPLTLHNSLGDTVIDVLVKMIRVVANMSVNTEVGIGLGNMHNLGIIMLNLLNAITHMKAIQLKSDLQELLHATLGALHNLCFYQEQNSTPAQVLAAKGSLQCVLGDLATALYYALKTCRDDASQVETARVLGNLTRNDKARRYFCRNGGLALVVKQLSANNTSQAYDFKACAIGVLVNLLGDAENRAPFMQHKGAELLYTLLGAALQEEDWFLATIICQALWNLLIDASNVSDVCQEQVLDDVCDLLVDYLDEERLFEHSTRPDMVWEGFAVVATDLLERIQASYDKQEQEEAEAEIKKQKQQQKKSQKVNVENKGEEEEDEDDVYIEEM